MHRLAAGRSGGVAGNDGRRRKLPRTSRVACRLRENRWKSERGSAHCEIVPRAQNREESSMENTRRGFLRAAMTVAGAATAPSYAQAQTGHQGQAVPSDPALRVKSLESLLVDKGLVDPKAVDALIDTYEHKVGPRNGARVVARAWVDPSYKQRLLTDADVALKEFGYGGLQGEHMVAVENTATVHNLVVCTLC